MGKWCFCFAKSPTLENDEGISSKPPTGKNNGVNSTAKPPTSPAIRPPVENNERTSAETPTLENNQENASAEPAASERNEATSPGKPPSLEKNENTEDTSPSTDEKDPCRYGELRDILSSLGGDDIRYLIKFLECKKTPNSVPTRLTNKNYLQGGWIWIEKEVLAYKDMDIPNFIGQLLTILGTSNLLLLGLFFAGVALDRYITVQSNERKCWHLLHMMKITAVTLQDLRDHNFGESTKAIKEAMRIVVENCILCCDYLTKRSFTQIWKAKQIADQINEARQALDAAMTLVGRECDSKILVAFNKLKESLKENFHYYVMPANQRLEGHTVGLDDQIKTVTGLLEIDGTNEPAVAVIIWGFGGIGKSTLADASIQKLHPSLENLRFSYVVFDNTIDNGRPSHIAKLQEQIVDNLTGTAHKFGDPKSGRNSLKEVLEKTSSFLFIDNVEKRIDLEELLPRVLCLEKGIRLRILITSRERELKSAIPKGCKFKEHQMSPLSPQNGFDLLISALMDSDMEYSESFSGEKEKLEEIAELCDGIPFLLKVIGRQLQDNRCLDFYDDILKKLQRGEIPGDALNAKTHEVISFVLTRLNSDLQDAFIDLCVYFLCQDQPFNGWNFVCKAVGEGNMNALLRKGLVTRAENMGLSQIIVPDILKRIALNEGRKFYILSKDEWDKASKNTEKLKVVKGILLSCHFSVGVLVQAEQLDSTCETLRLLSLDEATRVTGQCQQDFGQLRYLSISSTQLQTFPFKQVSSLTNLRYLYLHDQPIDIPKEIWSLQWLSYLTLANCNNLTCLPKHIGKMKQLKELVILDCPIAELPQNFSSLTSLQECQISNTMLKQLPTDFGRGLSSLNTLILRNNYHLRRLSRSFGELKQLKILEVGGPVEELPETFTKLASLEICRLGTGFVKAMSISEGARVELRELPSGFGRSFTTLKTLALCTSNCRSLPEDFASLQTLEDLCLQGLDASALPRGFSSLTRLKSLALLECPELETLPHDIASLCSLETLALRNLGISELSEVFCFLPNLKYLVIESCKELKSIPENIGSLTALKGLRLQDMGMVELPNSFSSLKNLASLELRQLRELTQLPESTGKLCLLQCMHLEDLGITELPRSLSFLRQLESLNLSTLSRVRRLPRNIVGLSNLRCLDLRECESMEEKVIDQVFQLEKLRVLDISGSPSLCRRCSRLSKPTNLKIIYVEANDSVSSKTNLQISESRDYRD